ncbi:helix-turn-helix transcriptional regulator [Cupriavidus pauculus]|uniref:helix-turn-helix transcriptional regulator n=1 Tax=Cupriavidus pauculus TaxID=82633 RepID=UPI000781544B|nr:helix-turn-helix transcriptional regulator [Cupriavidus pauculus]
MDHRRQLHDKADEMRRKIGEVLRSERERQGSKQSDIAQKVGVSRATVIAIESGQSVSTLNLLLVAAAVGVNLTSQPDPAIATPPRRPMLREMMRAERERQAMLQAKLSSRQRVGSASFTAPVSYPESNIRHRPTLREMMRAERERQAMLQTNLLNKVSQ